MNIWARGGLGNQILEYFFGIAYAKYYNKKFRLYFSTKPAPSFANVFHVEDYPKINELFKFNHEILVRNNKYKKFCYWHSKFIDIYFEQRENILGNQIKPKFKRDIKNKYTVLHVRGTDKMNSAESLKVYRPLVNKAKSFNLPIKIVTDDPELSNLISKSCGIEFKNSNNTVHEDWLTILNAEKIVSVYSTFAYSILLIDPLKEYIIPDYRSSSDQYLYSANEYRALSQMMKYCPNLQILDSHNLAFSYSKSPYLKSSKAITPIELINLIFSKGYISNDEGSFLEKKLKEIPISKDQKSILLKILNMIMNPLLPRWVPLTVKAEEIKYRYHFRQKIFSNANNLFQNRFSPTHFLFRGVELIRIYISFLNYKQMTQSTRQTLMSNKKDLKANINLCEKLDKNGYLLINNFLNTENLENFQKLMHKKSKELNFLVNHNSKGIRKELIRYFLNSEIINLLSLTSGYPTNKVRDQIIKNISCKKSKFIFNNSSREPKLNFSSFYQSFSFYYFPQVPVDDKENLTFIKHSHIPSLSRMRYEFEKSIQENMVKKQKTLDFVDYFSSGIENQNLPKDQLFIKNNSLLIINNFGFVCEDKLDISEKIFIEGKINHDSPILFNN